jgi:hypothetical protein
MKPDLEREPNMRIVKVRIAAAAGFLAVMGALAAAPVNAGR